MSKKVLIFTYYFPPAGGVAVQRFLKFSKFLPAFDWEPIIITVQNGSYPYYDESLLKEVSPALRVYRTKTFEPFELYNLLQGKKGKAMPLVAVGSRKKQSLFGRVAEYIRANFFVPDARKGWVPYAVKQAEEIIKAEKIDAIITTGPPHSTHLAGLQLKQKHGVKWLADFRDPWTGIFYNKLLPRTEATAKKDKALETSVLQQADYVTVISPGMKEEFGSRTKNIQVVYNGYDEEDFAAPAIARTKQFVIRYAGNLMASQNVEALWQALGELKAQGANFSVELIGRVDAEVKECAEKYLPAAAINYLNFVEHKAAIKLMQEASLLLFVIPAVADNHLIMTGKLYEYLASRTEIISVGPPTGNAAVALQQAGRKAMIDYTDKAQILEQLQMAYSHFTQNGRAYKYPDDKHAIFSRKNQAKALADILNGL